MNNKKRFLLPLLFVTPLLMGNSPAPFPTDEEYGNIDVTCSFIKEVEKGYQYQIIMNNNGDSYASLSDLRQNGRHIYQSQVDGLLSLSEYLSPSNSKTYTIVTDYQLNIQDEDVWSTTTFAIKDEGVTFKNSSIVKSGDLGLKLKSDISGLEDHYYSAIVDFDYEGTNYALEFHLKSSQTVYINEDIDVSKITINKITAFRSSYHTYKVNWKNALIVLIPIIAICVFLFLVVPAITVAIVVVANQNKKKKREREQIDSKE